MSERLLPNVWPPQGIHQESGWRNQRSRARDPVPVPVPDPDQSIQRVRTAGFEPSVPLISPCERTALPRDAYLAYLNSPAWRQRRNAKLHRVGWQCERCPSKRNLQVHHRTYDRFGAEWDDDLEVLCADCHEQHHIDAIDAPGIGIYLKFAREALHATPFASIGDLSDDTKRLCAKRHVPYSGWEVNRAIGLITGTRITRVQVPRVRLWMPPDPAAINPQDAHEILRRLLQDVPIASVIKTMGAQRSRDHEALVMEQAGKMKQALAREQRRPSLMERLTDIFRTQPW